MAQTAPSILRKKKLLFSIFTSLVEDYVIVIIGQSGSGQGTLSDNLRGVCPQEYLTIPAIDTGTLFRRTMKTLSGTIRKRLREINDAGKRQSWILAVAFVTMTGLRKWTKKGLRIISGSPRSEDEAKALYAFITETLGKKMIMVHLAIDDELAVERILGRNRKEKRSGGKRRTDTTDEASIRTKLAVYQVDVIPAINYMMMQEDVHTMEVKIEEGKSERDVLREVLGRMPVR